MAIQQQMHHHELAKDQPGSDSEQKYNLMIHQHQFLLHNSFPEEFPVCSCFPLRSSSGMAENPHIKFHTGTIERGRIVSLRRCNADSIYLYFMGVAAEKPSQFIN